MNKHPDTSIAADPLLTGREVAVMLGISLPSVFRRVSDGTIPRPVKLGAASRWPQSEIIAVIEAAKAARIAAE